MSDRTIFQGDSHTERATLTDENGIPIDDVQATYRLTVKRSYDDDDFDAIVSTTAVQSSPGIAYLTIQPGDLAGIETPAVLVYDVEVREVDGRTTTLSQGKLIVLPSAFVGP